MRSSAYPDVHADVLILGAGVVGLSIALELHRRGAGVTVLERGDCLAEASSAAAGMLAASDPDNPPTLRPLSDLSLRLYPEFLAHIQALSGHLVPFQTNLTLQQTYPATRGVTAAQLDRLLPGHALHQLHFAPLAERSVDPRQLAPALLAAVRSTSIQLLEHTPMLSVITGEDFASVRTLGQTITADFVVDCTGAWTRSDYLAASLPVFPIKGQMLSLALPSGFPLDLSLRTHGLYLVPRTTGPHAGRAIVGATIEVSGFAKTTTPDAIRTLYDRVCHLLPPLAGAPILEQWAGLRPATHDRLPILGALPESPRHLFATAHFRNGILLAPATAQVIAALIAGERPAVDLACFSPARLAAVPA